MSNLMLDRRGFVALVAGTMAMPSLACGQSSKGSQPSLGFSLYGMKSLPLDVALSTCANIGYQHVELALNAGYPSEPSVFTPEARKTTAALLKSLRLDLPCLMVMINLTADDKAHAAALKLIADAGEMAQHLVPERPPILETVLGGSPSKWEQQKSVMVDRLRDWAQAAEKAHTSIAIKAHVNSAVNSPERLLWLMEQVPSSAIHAAYDFSHFAVQKMDMEESMKLLLPRTQFIHVKDFTGDASKFQFLLPGEGNIDYVKYFSLLKRFGYTGPVCVEVSGQVFNKPDYDPIAAAKKCFAALSTARSQAFDAK